MPTLHTLFQSIPVEVPSHFESSLVLSLQLEAERLRQRRLLITQYGVIGAGILLFTTLFWTIPLLAQSDFWRMISLLFTDFPVMSTFFEDFLYSLLETLPIYLIVVTLIPVLLLSTLLSQWVVVRDPTQIFRWNKSWLIS